MRLGDAIVSGDTATLEEIVDTHAMLERAIESLDADPDFKDGFRKGAQSKSSALLVVSKLGDKIGESGTLEWRRNWRHDGRSYALFRATLDDGSFNYLDFVIEPNAEGALRVVDFYSASAGAHISEIMMETTLVLVADLKTNEKGRTVVGGGFQAYIQSLTKAAGLRAQGKHAEALAEYMRIEPELRDSRTTMSARLRTAADVSDEVYLQQGERFAELFPDDPALAMSMIDIHVLRKRYDDALDAIASLQRVYGPDPYLDLLASGVCVMAEDFDRAHTFAQKGMEKEPDAIWGYVAMLPVLNSQQDFDALADHLLTMRERFGIPPAALVEDDPEYVVFAKSPAYQRIAND